ncbi:hypothetical protein PsorP6_011317 [Peronosclerospora sorghi]|uniref:Uncharacterized protein n=1 Tax=Peronosclerospora sorghi TaxID=230839 RepID=A0ACC0WKK9_9STRA|nr:hypothetical protein PsorP6_011317 [Peronosclerospora sorghi]
MMNQRRALEMYHLQVRKYLDEFFDARDCPRFGIYDTHFTGRDISAVDGFTAIALLDRLIFPMNYLPWILKGFPEAKVSAVCIRDFLFGRNDEIRTKYEARDIRTLKKHTQNNLMYLHDCAFVWNSSTGSRNDVSVDA